VIERELHKIFESNPDIMASVFAEAGIISRDQRPKFHVLYSAYRNRLRLRSGFPDMVAGIQGWKKHYVVELKTVSSVSLNQILDYHRDLTDMLRKGEYPHDVETFDPVFICPRIAEDVKDELNKGGVLSIELDRLRRWNTVNVLKERDMRVYESAMVRKEITTRAMYRATYVLPLIDLLYKEYKGGVKTMERKQLLNRRQQILGGRFGRPAQRVDPFARIGMILNIAQDLGLATVHTKGHTIVGASLTPIGLEVAKQGEDTQQVSQFSLDQLAIILEHLVDNPFRNPLVYGIFAMLETAIELKTDLRRATDHSEHLRDVFKHKVGICEKEEQTINSHITYYLNYCEDLGLIVRYPDRIFVSQVGDAAYRVMRTNEVEEVSKMEIRHYLSPRFS